MIILLAILGGLFANLALVHFIIDFWPQSHKEAMAKSTNKKVRARHCLVYTLGFVPILFLVKMPIVPFIICLLVLFFSHFFQDSYWSVVLWAKYIRKPPQLENKQTKEELIAAFKEWAQTPLGNLLMVAIDQSIHLTWLIPVAILMMLYGSWLLPTWFVVY